VVESADLAFLQFDLAGQAYALPLEQVRSVILAPAQTTMLPQTDPMMLGVMPWRGVILPLISLRSLLGLPQGAQSATDRVVVASLGGAILGLVVDSVRAILRAHAREVGPVPSVLNRGAGEARIDAIVRAPQGLVSVLAAERIFEEETVAQLIAEGGGRDAGDGDQQEGEGAMEQFVLFRLADETYGLPVGAVREVLRLPETVTRVPRAPDFVAGVINHRGVVVPLIDQRRRFAVPGEETVRQRRIIVANVDDLVAGFIVDAVEQILTVPADALRPAPELAAADEPVFDRIATLELDGRLVLLIEPRQLLDQTERDVVRDVARRSNAEPA
jgi:purine-binding chemotaxis protein CheW